MYIFTVCLPTHILQSICHKQTAFDIYHPALNITIFTITDHLKHLLDSAHDFQIRINGILCRKYIYEICNVIILTSIQTTALLIWSDRYKFHSTLCDINFYLSTGYQVDYYMYFTSIRQCMYSRVSHSHHHQNK